MAGFIKNRASEEGQFEIAKAILSLNGDEYTRDDSIFEFNDKGATENGQVAIANAIRSLGGDDVDVPTTGKEFLDKPASVDGQKEIIDAIISVRGNIGGGGTPTLEDKTVKSTTRRQTVVAGSGYDGIGTVTVEPIVLEDKEVVLLQSQQVIRAGSDKDGLSSVTVPGVSLQDKTVTPSTIQQSVTADYEYDGLGTVTLSAMDLETKTVKSTTSSQTVLPTSGKDGISEVTVEPISLENKTVHSGATQTTVTAGSSYDGIGTVTVEALDLETKTVKSTDTQQTITPTSGKDGISEITVSPIVLQDKTINPTSSSQTVSADSGYDGLGQVTVNAASSSAPNLQDKTVNPSNSIQTITADSGYDGLDTVTVSAARLQSETVRATTSDQTLTPSSPNIGFSQVTVQKNRLQNKTVTPSSSQQTINADDLGTLFEGLGTVTVNAVSLQNKTITPTSSQQTVSADSGYNGLGTVTVEKDKSVVMNNNYDTSNATLLDFSDTPDMSTFRGWTRYFMSTADDTSLPRGHSALGAPFLCKIKLPASTTIIIHRAFMGMSGLAEIDASAITGQVSIYTRAFAAVPKLSTLGTLWSKIKAVTNNSFRPIWNGDVVSICEQGKDIVAPILDTYDTSVSQGYDSQPFKSMGWHSFTAPKLPHISSYCFWSCQNMVYADFTDVTRIDDYAFYDCSALTDLWLRGSSVVTLSNVNAFNGVDLSGLTVHVPASLVTQYQQETNWAELVTTDGVTFVGI